MEIVMALAACSLKSPVRSCFGSVRLRGPIYFDGCRCAGRWIIGDEPPRFRKHTILPGFDRAQRTLQFTVPGRRFAARGRRNRLQVESMRCGLLQAWRPGFRPAPGDESRAESPACREH